MGQQQSEAAPPGRLFYAAKGGQTMAKDKPELPDTVSWPPATKQWFESWRASPRTDGWDEAQWQYMFDTALVHALVWGKQDTAMLAELRQRTRCLGLTFDIAKEPPVVRVDKSKLTTLEEIRRLHEERKAAPRRRSARS
jgi:hypothetical protein